MKILVACEESQVVTTAFRWLGHEAISCDLRPTSGDFPEWHRQQDVLYLLWEPWDMIIAFPPCTDLAGSGAQFFGLKQFSGSQQQAIDFFMLFANSKCPKVAIENPVGIMSTLYRKPDQIIQPWMFGHPEQKRTCLWLKGLPKLIPTHDVRDEMLMLPKKDRQRSQFIHPQLNRAVLRSKTLSGVGEAMAQQWGGEQTLY